MVHDEKKKLEELGGEERKKLVSALDELARDPRASIIEALQALEKYDDTLRALQCESIAARERKEG